MDGVIVNGASIDSRTVKEGDLFTSRFEGASKRPQIRGKCNRERCSRITLDERRTESATKIPLIFVEDPETHFKKWHVPIAICCIVQVIGITGSNGKTSTKDLVASVLSPYFNVRKTEGNLNNELGLPLTILSLDKDTEFAVLEMGMSGFGEISFLSKLAKPHYVVITNIGEAHMHDLGSREGIAKAKLEIIDGLADGGKLFYDGDEALLEALIDNCRCGNNLIRCGRREYFVPRNRLNQLRTEAAFR